MLNRQKVLLNLIQELEARGVRSRRAIVKSLFLLKKEYFLDNYVSFYSFYPYKQGPFSQMCFGDLRKMHQEGMMDAEETSLTEKGAHTANTYATFNSQIHHMLSRFSTEKQMTAYVYSKYPEFTVKSELIEDKKPRCGIPGFTTIGYEGRSIDDFLNILIQNDIAVVADVRRNPFSMNFQFIRQKLKEYLESADIAYMHIPELGIESEKRRNLETRADYIKLFSEYKQGLAEKQKHLEEIILIGKEKRIALLCFEKDPAFCHRGIIAEYLRENGCEVADL